MSVSISAGQVIGGKYELVRQLGRGSMGEVWVAYHRTLFEEVAMKLLSGLPSTGPNDDPSTAAARFRFEAQIAARLSRKTRHIVRVTDHGEEEGLAYLIMELLDGQTLEARLLAGGCLQLRETLALVAQIARGLAAAHRGGVVHRDLKPSNVFLARGEDGEDLIKLLDFGIARTIHTFRVPPSFATGEGLVFGTPGYMSPEQATPGSKLDERCDLWALSTLAYEALTGTLPVEGAYTEELLGNLVAGRIVPIHERKPELPGVLATFFATAFARDIDARFRTARGLAQQFESVIAAAERGSLRVAPAQTLEGNTVHITFPMRTRPGKKFQLSPGGHPAPSQIVALAIVAMLMGLAMVGTAWRALALRANTSKPSPADESTKVVMDRVDVPVAFSPATAAFSPATQQTMEAPPTVLPPLAQPEQDVKPVRSARAATVMPEREYGPTRPSAVVKSRPVSSSTAPASVPGPAPTPSARAEKRPDKSEVL